MQQITNVTPELNAYLRYLESRGMYSAEASEWANACHSDVHTVAAPIEPWLRYLSAVGAENARQLLSTVIGEYNSLNDHWALTNYYRAMSCSGYSANDVLDLFMDLEDGHRKNAAIAFVRRYKRGCDNSLETTVHALGAFSGLLMTTSNFFSEVLAMLDQYQNGYYTKAFDIAIRAITDGALVLSLSKRTGMGAFVTVRPLDSELGLVCSGNAALIKMFRKSVQDAQSNKAAMAANLVIENLINRSKQRYDC